MDQPTVASYGSWRSPITSDAIVAGTIGLSQIVLDGDDIYWLEARPEEQGRNVVVRRTPDGQISDVTPPPYNVRTRVHEYGGGAYTVCDGVVYFANFSDQRLYRQDPAAAPRPLTPETPDAALRYADMIVDRARQRLVCVREDHRASDREAVNTVVAVSIEGDETGGQVLVSGDDFFSSPRLSPDGSQLAALAWNHPNMPWDGTELWVGELTANGAIGEARRVAGGLTESIFQPEWSPDGTLYFVSDRTGWWNLYRWRGGEAERREGGEGEGEIEALCPMEAEFGEPQWVFGLSLYGFASADQLICVYFKDGLGHLARLDMASRTLSDLPTPYTDMGDVRVRPGETVFLAGSPVETWSVVRYDLATDEPQVLRRSSQLDLPNAYLSIPPPIEFPTEGGRTAHAFYYPPQNPEFVAPAGELPPLIVQSHGGPTGATSAVLSPALQYWTSRGFAVLDVNYGGSTGYGRAYRERLKGQWGIVDVDDCVNGAEYLVERGLVDGKRLAIRGGSAGGFTVLAALAFHDVFKAGANYYGVSDLEALARDTHKFESRYLDRLVAPLPEGRAIYEARAPIRHLEHFNAALITFQGVDDKVVPPEQ